MDHHVLGLPERINFNDAWPSPSQGETGREIQAFLTNPHTFVPQYIAWIKMYIYMNFYICSNLAFIYVRISE